MVVSIDYFLNISFFIVTGRQFSHSHQPCSEKNNLVLLFFIKPDEIVFGSILGISTSCFG